MSCRTSSLAKTTAAVALISLLALPVVAKSPPDWNKVLDKGIHEMEVGNTDKAVAIFAEKVKRYPDSGACHTCLGKAYKRWGKIDLAKTSFRTATEVEPTYAEAYYEYGAVLESDQQWKEAVSAFEHFAQLSPDAAKRLAVPDRIAFCKSKQK